MTRSIGFRCTKNSITFVVLEGHQEAPLVLAQDVRQVPKNISRPEELRWLRREVHDILNTYGVEVGFYRSTEPSSKTRDMQRGEFEGVLQEAALSHEQRNLLLESRIKVQIKSNTGLTKKDDVEELLESEAFMSIPSKSKYADAYLVALCGLPRRENNG
jgi:Holliday junction resolvasome RuvABC endonuclease subunit